MLSPKFYAWYICIAILHAEEYEDSKIVRFWLEFFCLCLNVEQANEIVIKGRFRGGAWDAKTPPFKKFYLMLAIGSW